MAPRLRNRAARCSRWLFERVVNLSRIHAPEAATAFNATGADSAVAVQRWLPGRADPG